MKECTKCKKPKSLKKFSRHSSTRDGRRSQCKVCVGIYYKKWQRENAKECGAHHKKWRQKNPKKCRASNKRWRREHRKQYRTTQRRLYAKNPEKHIKAAKEYRETHPKAAKAREECYNAVRRGDLIRPDRCEKCKKRRKVHGHHDDYSKPLEVRWLCSECHSEVHQEIKE